MNIGFTGTQRGMSTSQKETLKTLFAKLIIVDKECEFHHGDCIGMGV